MGNGDLPADLHHIHAWGIVRNQKAKQGAFRGSLISWRRKVKVMAEGKVVIVGSKLPISLILRHPLDRMKTVTIRGLNSAQRGTNGQPIQVPYITTEIDAEFWSAWKLGNGAFQPFVSGAIFEAKTEEAASKIYRERETERTGLEPARSTEFGVKTATDKD
jgi:hypothetical protein